MLAMTTGTRLCSPAPIILWRTLKGKATEDTETTEESLSKSHAANMKDRKQHTLIPLGGLGDLCGSNTPP